MTNQPNFLILMVDQLNGQFFTDGPADFLHTPALRKLANNSVNFSNTYCASPLCSPARASFMCGALPSSTSVYDNAAELPSTLPTFAHSLRSLGYKTILSGKMHFVGADQLHGFEERLTTDIYPADFGWTPDWSKPGERVDWWYHNLGSVTGAGVAITSNQLEFDDEVAYQAKLKLHQLARTKSAADEYQPFCLTVSFTHPHDPYVTRKKYWDLYPEADLPPLNVAAITEQEQDPHSQRLYHTVDQKNFEVSGQHLLNARRAYFANISYLDEKIGEILATLDDCGFGDDTVVVFCADHGDMLGERGLWFKMSFFEGSMRVPLLLSAPGRFQPASITEPVSMMDLAPTLVELAGGSVKDHLIAEHGTSLLACAQGDARPDHPVLGEYTGEGSIDPMLMIRRQQWKFVYCEADPPQLFDLNRDPFEKLNFATDPEQQDLVEQFIRETHQRWDVGAFRTAVTRSQQRRLEVYGALRRGNYAAWDYQPAQDASQRYMRNHLDLNIVEATARVPREVDPGE